MSWLGRRLLWLHRRILQVWQLLWSQHRAPGRVRSLLARAALVEGPLRRARWFGRKLWLTARERL